MQDGAIVTININRSLTCRSWHHSIAYDLSNGVISSYLEWPL